MPGVFCRGRYFWRCEKNNHHLGAPLTPDQWRRFHDPYIRHKIQVPTMNVSCMEIREVDVREFTQQPYKVQYLHFWYLIFVGEFNWIFFDTPTINYIVGG